MRKTLAAIASAGVALIPTPALAKGHRPVPAPVVGPVAASHQPRPPRPPHALPFVAIAYWTVRPGDTLWSLASRFDGDGRTWRDLARANHVRPRHLQVGSTLTIVLPITRG